MTSALYRIGWIYNDLEDYESAVDPLKRVIAIQPNNAAAHFELGYSYKKLERYHEALARSYKPFGSSPTTHPHTTRSAGSITNRRNYNEAIKSLNTSLSYRAGYPDAHNELGYALRNLDRNSEAIQAYREAIRLKPDMGLAHLGLGDVYYYNTKQYAEAAKAYKQGLQYRPNNATAQYNLGWCYNDLERYTEAIEELRKAIQLKPNYPEAYNEMGYALHQLGRYAEAVQQYQIAIRQKGELRLGPLQSRYVVHRAEQSQRGAGAVSDPAAHRRRARDKTFQSNQVKHPNGATLHHNCRLTGLLRASPFHWFR